MIRASVLLVFAATFVLPAVTGWALWRARGDSAALVVLRSVTSLLGLALFLVVCNWSLVAVWVAPLLGIACSAVILAPLRRASRLPLLPPMSLRRSAHFAAWGGSVIVLALPLAAVLGSAYPDRAVDLRFPLREPWYVFQGGPHILLNAHRSARAQSYALDVVGLTRWGARAVGVLPADLARYAIFDSPVYSPCNGEVLGAEDGHADHTPPERSAATPAGNHVAIQCGDTTVLLAHLRRGSVLPQSGEGLESGELIGRVGNSGNTTEPHLHIHAVRGRVTSIEGLLASGTPIPMRFDGRLLHRHSSSLWTRLSSASPDGGAKR